MYTAMLSPRSVVYRCWGLNYLSRIIEVHYTFVTKVIGGPGGGGELYKYFTVLPNSTQRQKFHNIFVRSSFQPHIAASMNLKFCGKNFVGKIFVAMLRPAKSAKIFNLKNFRLYSS